MTEEHGRSTESNRDGGGGTEAAPSPADAVSPTANPGLSDRLLGLLCLAIGLWYTIEARTFETTAFGSGPVGPKTMPTGVGLLFMGLAASLVVRPDRGPSWPSARAGWQIGLVLASSYLYGQVIEPVGFIVASAAMILIIGTLFRAPVRFLVPAAIAFPVVLAFVFNNLLELQLPDGWWGGF